MYKVTFNYPRWKSDYTFTDQDEAKRFADFWGGVVC